MTDAIQTAVAEMNRVGHSIEQRLSLRIKQSRQIAIINLAAAFCILLGTGLLIVGKI